MRSERNTDLQSVRQAEFYSAELGSSGENLRRAHRAQPCDPLSAAKETRRGGDGLRWIDRSTGDAEMKAASPPYFNIEQETARSTLTPERKLAQGRRRNGLWPGGDRIVADHHIMALIGGCWARWKGRTNNRTRVTRSTSDQNRHEEVDPSVREGL